MRCGWHLQRERVDQIGKRHWGFIAYGWGSPLLPRSITKGVLTSGPMKVKLPELTSSLVSASVISIGSITKMTEPMSSDEVCVDRKQPRMKVPV